MDLFFGYFIGTMITGIFMIISYIISMNDASVKTSNQDIFGAICLVLLWPLFWVIFIASRFTLK